MIRPDQLQRVNILADDMGMSDADRAEVIRLVGELNEDTDSLELNIALGKIASLYLPGWLGRNA